MSLTVAVLCRECLGSTNGPDGFCGWCQAQGHESINRLPDGSVPLMHDDGRPVVLWLPVELPETPNNPLVPLYQRCIP